MDDAARPTDMELPPELLVLRQRFVQRLPSQLIDLFALLAQFEAQPWDHGAGETLHRMVHSLTGTSGTFGFKELSALARHIEHQLAPWINHRTAPTPAQWAALQPDFLRLRQCVQAAVESTVPTAPAPERLAPTALAGATGSLVHFVAPPSPARERLCTALRADGYAVQCFNGPEDFRRHTAVPGAAWPRAVVLDAPVNGAHDQHLPSLVEQLGLAEHPDIALVVALRQCDQATRLAVARAGARRCLHQPLDPEQLVDALNHLTQRTPDQAWRVLMVDDDEQLLDAHAALLRRAGMEVQTTSDAMQTLERVDRFQPDVLILDVYMPEVSGPELASLLREGNEHPHLAILFLSAETDMTQQLLALNLGGDDFLIKPVQAAHLVAAVTARARRARQSHSMRQRLETTLYERQREHLAVNEHAFVNITDPAGNITYANELFCTVSGYSQEELLANDHRLLTSGKHPPEFSANLWATISSGRVWQGEICFKRRDNSLFWVATTITPFLDADGAPYQYVSIQTDITHIKEAEAALRRQRDMQRMVSLTATRLMAAPSNLGAEAVCAALRASGEHLEADHAFLFRIAKGGISMRNTHFWHSPGSFFDVGHLKHIELQQFKWMRAVFNRNGMVVVPDVLLLPEEAAMEKSVLGETQVRALIAFPMTKGGVVSGFVGYTSLRPMPHWTQEVSELLSVLSEVIASALARQRAENALRESESRLSFLVSSSPVTIYTRAWVAPYALTYVSPNVDAVMGLHAHAFTQAPDFWAQQIHPEDRPRVEALLPTMTDGQVHQHEYRLRNGHGDYRWVQDQLRLACDEASGTAELVGYWMDITDRKSAESEVSLFNHELEQRVALQTQSVIESERFARATLDALDARVAILDAQGDILAVNRAWREAMGEPGSAIIGQGGANYLASADEMCGTQKDGARPIAQGLSDVLEGKSPHFFHEYACPKAVEPQWFACRVKRFPGDGALRVVVSHEDITTMKRMERQQMRSQRLESLGTLAGGVAHDLNNSLAPILMGMGMLQEQFPEETKLISMIHNSAQRGADMVRQLLTFAKGADGKRVSLQPSHLVRELESLMKGSFPKNIELRTHCEIGLPPVLGDATQLHQILLNLCVNARDAMSHGGTLSLEAQTVDIDAMYALTVSDAKPGRYVCLRVADTGEGIAPELLDHIFDPFFTTKSQEKGTGLGLSTLLGIVKGHGGFVQVYSVPGEGSSFTVHIPVSLNPDGASEAGELAQAFRGSGETILFVDDEPILRQVGQTVLERLGFTPIVAEDGEDGLIKATENRAHLKAIITDMHMPHMDGLAFVHAVRRTLPKIPIILASGRVEEQLVKHFRELGVTARLDKPFTEAQLAEALRTALLQGSPANA